jgi:hypothetical protein
MKEIMTGDDSKPPATLCVSLAAELQKSGIVLQLLQSLELLQFEARKDWVRQFLSLYYHAYRGCLLTLAPLTLLSRMNVGDGIYIYREE